MKTVTPQQPRERILVARSIHLEEVEQWLSENILSDYLAKVDPAKVSCPQAFGFIRRDGLPENFESLPESAQNSFFDSDRVELSWFAFGPAGAGKTRSVALLVKHLLREEAATTDLTEWWTARHLVGRLAKLRTHDPEGYEERLDEIRYLDLLVLDEVDRALTASQAEILRDVLEMVRGNRGGRLLVTSNFSLAELAEGWRAADPAGKAIRRLRDIVVPVCFNPLPVATSPDARKAETTNVVELRGQVTRALDASPQRADRKETTDEKKEA